jgi:hypothetical protein
VLLNLSSFSGQIKDDLLSKPNIVAEPIKKEKQEKQEILQESITNQIPEIKPPEQSIEAVSPIVVEPLPVIAERVPKPVIDIHFLPSEPFIETTDEYRILRVRTTSDSSDKITFRVKINEFKEDTAFGKKALFLIENLENRLRSYTQGGELQKDDSKLIEVARQSISEPQNVEFKIHHSPPPKDYPLGLSFDILINGLDRYAESVGCTKRFALFIDENDLLQLRETIPITFDFRQSRNAENIMPLFYELKQILDTSHPGAIDSLREKNSVSIYVNADVKQQLKNIEYELRSNLIVTFVIPSELEARGIRNLPETQLVIMKCEYFDSCLSESSA